MMKQQLSLHLKGSMDSYAQLFLSNNLVFGLFIFVATFIDPLTGMGGLLAVFFTQSLATLFHFNKHYIEKGYYGFNSLLTGLYIGHAFVWNWQLVILIFFISFFCLILTVAASSWLSSRNLP